jgi:hypothetical protein
LQIHTVKTRSGKSYEVKVDEGVKLPSKITRMGDYFAVRVDGKSVYLHRWLMNAPKGLVVDHKNGDVSDNRLENLRLATKSQNAVNRKNKPHKASFHKASGKWRARIYKDYKETTLYFNSEEEAERELKRIHVEIHGEFSPHWEEC